MSAVADSGSDSEPPQFFHHAWSAHHMMRKMGYNLQRGNDLNSWRGRLGLLRTFVSKGKPANYNDKTCRGLGYIIPPTQSQSEENESLPSHSSSSSEWELDVNVGVLLKNLFVNITSINQLEQEKAIEMFELSHGIEMFHAEHGLNNSISCGRSNLNNVNCPLRIR